MALVGCGSIGRVIARAFGHGVLRGRIVAVCDIRRGAAEGLARSLSPRPRIATLGEAVRRADCVVECATAAAVPAVAREALAHGRDVLVMSVAGVLANPGLLKLAARSRGRLVVPSGALGALDALKAGAVAGLGRVDLVTSKPPASLKDAPYVRSRRMNLSGLKRPRVVFRGNALGAARGFPSNLNVAATVALAGVGPRRTRVTIVADPRLKRNVHELSFEGPFGRARFRVENVPSPDNPKTSYLAALSAVAALKRLLGGFSPGS